MKASCSNSTRDYTGNGAFLSDIRSRKQWICLFLGRCLPCEQGARNDNDEVNDNEDAVLHHAKPIGDQIDVTQYAVHEFEPNESPDCAEVLMWLARGPQHKCGNTQY